MHQRLRPNVIRRGCRAGHHDGATSRPADQTGEHRRPRRIGEPGPRILPAVSHRGPATISSVPELMAEAAIMAGECAGGNCAKNHGFMNKKFVDPL